jgi:hypothetical protein
VAVLALATCLGPVVAQTKAPESITVTGTRDRQVLEKFVQGFAVPSRMTGKLPRWEEEVCPLVVGVRPQAAAFIADRVRRIAAEIGAPVGAGRCRTNIQIVFTTRPQALMDHVRANQEAFLGYTDNRAQRAALATVRRPIQAWYNTETKDLRGKIDVDGAKGGGVVLGSMTMPYAHIVEVSGSRLGNGLHSALHHVTIVAEPGKLLDQELGTLADYIAMLALAQIPVPDACQPLPSIANLLVADCAQKPAAMTANDLAYLRGLYKMSADLSLGTQENEIAYQMERALAGK